MSVFELGMLAFFGISWPISVVKSWRSKSTEGKSVFFTIAILIGYVCGILHKLLYSRDFVLVLYLFNFCMVLIDIILYFVNRRREQATASGLLPE